MEIVRLTAAGAFAAAAFPYLERDEAEHNVLLGVTARLLAGGRGGWVEPAGEPGFWVAQEEGETIGCAMVTPPFDLVLSRCRPGVATALASSLHGEGVALPGVTGSSDPADEFAAGWESATGALATTWRRERIYELRGAAIRPDGVSGTPRAATPDDLELLTGWLAAFAEFVGEPMDAFAAASDVIDGDRALLWTDPDPVSVAIRGRLTPNGASVGPVFTPPTLRGRGYASAVTAALSARLLSEGRAFCCLYTDLANPTSNRIYQRIGYRPVVDVSHYRFSERR